MATLKRKPAALAVESAIPAVTPIIGERLNQAEAAIAAARMKKGTTKKGRIIVKDGVDFDALGREAAEMFLGNEAEIATARKELEQIARVSRGTLWLSYAMQTDGPESITTMVSAFKEACEARGHKRAASDASDFKAFCLAYHKSADEVLGVLAESENYHSAMKELRAIKNEGKVDGRSKGNARKATLSDKSFRKVIEMVSRMNAKQLTALHKAGASRAAVLRKGGEVFEAFTK